MRREQFDRHDAVVGRRVMRPPHLAHAAAAQQLDKAVASERCPSLVHIGLPGSIGSANTVSRGISLADGNETVCYMPCRPRGRTPLRSTDSPTAAPATCGPCRY